MGTRVVKALAFPVYQKDWLFYAWKVSELPADAASQPNETITQSPGLVGAIAKRIASRVEHEWESIKEAKKGSLKGYVLRCVLFCASTCMKVNTAHSVCLPTSHLAELTWQITYRFAKYVLSKEDPTEAFFKAIPTTGKGNQIEISYPVRPHAQCVLLLNAASVASPCSRHGGTPMSFMRCRILLVKLMCAVICCSLPGIGSSTTRTGKGSPLSH